MADRAKGSKAAKWREAYSNILANNRALAVQNTSLRSKNTRRARDIGALTARIKVLRLDLLKARRRQQRPRVESADACTQTADSWMKDVLHELVDQSEVRVRSPSQHESPASSGPIAPPTMRATHFRSPQRQTSPATVVVTPPSRSKGKSSNMQKDGTSPALSGKSVLQKRLATVVSSSRNN